MSTIPASFSVQVIPAVLNAGGTGLTLQAIFLTNNTQLPYGVIAMFGDATSVGTYFGLNSAEYAAAIIYFAGFENSQIKPAALSFVQYPSAAIPAYLRGASLADISLATLKTYSGSLTVVMDGYSHVITSIDFSSYNSQSAMATAMQSAFTNPQQATSTASTIAGNTLTVGGTLTGSFAVGQTITGASVTANSIITALGSGTGGAGTYTLSQSSTIGSTQVINAAATPMTVTYDSLNNAFSFISGITGVVSTAVYATGTLAALLRLTQATGAVLSQGASTTTPAAFMTNITLQTQNWATFCTMFNPDSPGVITNKLAFAAWTNTQLDRYAYIAWDPDTSPAITVPATGSLGYAVRQATYSGTCLVYDINDEGLAYFVCGAAASIDYTQTNGRITFAFKSQAGLTGNVTNLTYALNLIANGYNFYGAEATAAQQFVWFQNGSISGRFQWLDSFVDQIAINNDLQLALMELFKNTRSIPYNQDGYNMIEAAVLDPINKYLNAGAIRAGVTLSAAQKSNVNSAAGNQNAAATIQQRGWYMQVLDALPIVRQARQSPPCNFWYTDGESVQKIVLTSTLIQ